eukprot:CAMPEP_0176057930 /NCGR_PEP_ID=MMETSP0120_2-20121206/28857_1 /TAXON_ID=160619 /ORGANISM="Kryptoperidinium foliaceum, Strain CCMP 1326" /LENGTH=904 /DNA_ID=CAMNT_0017391447 /DNA_START=55 /DNA_END=2766 /DNA_ORIENTATION=-
MAMEWRGDEARLGQLCQLLGAASSPDNQVQQKVRETLDQFSTWPDFNLYLATAFAQLTTQPEVVRQRAGLLLKTVLTRSAMEPQVAEYVQVQAMIAVRDPSTVVRHTAGTVITTLVNHIGIGACRTTLDRLAECLGDSNPEVVEGSFSAVNKICEDLVTSLTQMREDASKEVTLPVVNWCAERLLPRVIEFAQPAAPVHARRNAIECLNHFALSHMFHDATFPQFRQYGSKYVEVLGVLAQDGDTVVLKEVCKGFVCVIDNNWVGDNLQMCEVVLQYMMKASRHPEYVVRLEALEVWVPCTRSPQMLALVRPMLPELVPILLTNMVYSEADYLCMGPGVDDEDDAGKPDQPHDFEPRFHKDKGGDDDEDGDGGGAGGGAWGADWTARKAAASSLDNLANAFRAEILQVVLPLIQAKLEDPAWEVQESGVLAVGAIAIGCMRELVQFLPRVMELLLKHTEAGKPLLRSISCWTITRFSSWICHEQNEHREQVLRSVLQALLKRVLDRNKRVQEAACSAFATLEEEARCQLVPYLDDIVKTLVQAFQFYQDRNLLILYDASGTLAASVGADLAQAKYVEALMTPIMQKFDQVPDDGKTLMALFECLSHMVHNLGEALLPILPKITERCMRLAMNGVRAAQMWEQNPSACEKPDREIVAASIDFLSSAVEGLQTRVTEVLARQNFVCIVPEVLKCKPLQVRQSAFALVGDCAKICIDYLRPFLPEVIPLCAASLREHTSATVSNNASWSIGEICIKVGPEFMTPFMDDVLQALVSVLKRQRPGQQLLMQNICITLGRLGVVCAPIAAKAFGEFAQVWCEVMIHARPDLEKSTAFLGLISMVEANPQACMGCVPQLVAAICSCPCPEGFQQMTQKFQEILRSYKQALGANWPATYARMPEDVQWMAAQ